MPVPFGLALHTSSPELGLAMNPPDADLVQQTWDLGRDMSHQLHGHLATFMAPYGWEQLDFIAVAIGPGGFTGTRIGVVVARTLGQQLNLPVFGISTLAAVAWQACPVETVQTIAVQYSARRGALFGGIYHISGKSPLSKGGRGDSESDAEKAGLTTIASDRLYPNPDVWSDLVNQHSVAQTIAADNPLGGTVGQVLELGAIAYAKGERPSWAEVLPFYGQSPV
ncbi:MAG: tRNA (adenosine(37)-N6)-threonylcarbamoyltransferase complex dimerization subunit type 1 TsaB [Spirulina sp. SIO3F2]|nr:tRNA (adenosine(37)-N6)-threonylcarbamoyltransferase complex dimerization subunit type 1 TsaB [Spirulina sp. SIO3F2]